MIPSEHIAGLISYCRDFNAGHVEFLFNDAEGAPKVGVFVADEPELAARLKRECEVYDAEGEARFFDYLEGTEIIAARSLEEAQGWVQRTTPGEDYEVQEVSKDSLPEGWELEFRDWVRNGSEMPFQFLTSYA